MSFISSLMCCSGDGSQATHESQQWKNQPINGENGGSRSKYKKRVNEPASHSRSRPNGVTTTNRSSTESGNSGSLNKHNTKTNEAELDNTTSSSAINNHDTSGIENNVTHITTISTNQTSTISIDNDEMGKHLVRRNIKNEDSSDIDLSKSDQNSNDFDDNQEKNHVDITKGVMDNNAINGTFPSSSYEHKTEANDADDMNFGREQKEGGSEVRETGFSRDNDEKQRNNGKRESRGGHEGKEERDDASDRHGEEKREEGETEEEDKDEDSTYRDNETAYINLTYLQEDQYHAPGYDTLLPPKKKKFKNKKCLVLDLDETLVHSSFKYINTADFVLPVDIDDQIHNVYVIKRPGVDKFLKLVGELFEVVVFTASVSRYGDPLLDTLDKHNSVHHRLFREACYNYEGNYVKNLSQIGRPLSDIIILDNSPASYIFHPQHAIPISSWFSDTHDNELLNIIPLLEDLASKSVLDVGKVLDVTI